MKKYVIGFILGVIVATTVSVYAAPIMQWISGNGEPLGTPSNPVWISNNI